MNRTQFALAIFFAVATTACSTGTHATNNTLTKIVDQEASIAGQEAATYAAAMHKPTPATTPPATMQTRSTVSLSPVSAGCDPRVCRPVSPW